MAIAAATLGMIAAVAGVASPWWSGGRPGEGGTGRAVAAPVPNQASGLDRTPGGRTTGSGVTDPWRGRTAAAGTASGYTGSGAAGGTEPAPDRAAFGSPPLAVDPQGPDSGWIATLDGATAYYSAAGGRAEGTLPGSDPFGAAEVLAVVGRPGTDGWAEVRLPLRPNGSLGWIETAGTTLTWTSYRVTVSLEARTVTVTDAGVAVLTAPVAIGAGRTPTPAGQTYVWELIRPDDPAGAYGPYILGLAMFSDAISVFNGGDAQIAIHGNDDAASIGEAVSHGCVRVGNGVVTTLAGLIPLGTPVTIS